MKSSLFHIDNSFNSNRDGWSAGLKAMWQQNSVPLWLACLLAAIGTAVLISTVGLQLGMILFILLCGTPILVASTLKPSFGIIITLILAFFVLGLKKFLGEQLPFGLLLDVLAACMSLGLLFSGTKDWSFLKNPVSYVIAVWMLYNLLQLLNPYAASRMAWFYSIRSMAGLLVLYYVGLYVFRRFSMVQVFSTSLILLSLMAAAYGLWQEVFGLNKMEMNWLLSNEERFNLIFQGGRFRKFSFLSDPTSFGILMSLVSIFCLVLSTGPFASMTRALLIISAAFMISSMIFTGTRTAFVLLPAAFFFYVLINFKKRWIALSILLAVVGYILITIPTTNANLYRFQTAFKPHQDASLIVRLENQLFIQPFIRSHPIGGGLGSTGDWGKRFSPHSLLANFPPDSTYVRIAVEQGWLGLLLYLSLMFIILAMGVRSYFRCTSALHRTYILAFLVMLFALFLANYPQEASTQVPANIIFYLATAAMVQLGSKSQSAGREASSIKSY